MRLHKGTIDGITTAQSTIKIKTNSVIFDELEYVLTEYAVDTALTTWTAVVKNLLTYTSLPSAHILIEDEDKVELTIDLAVYEWQSSSIFDILNEIARFTNNNMFIDEYGLIVFYPRKTKNDCATLFSRGINLVENEIDRDASNIINSVNCAVAYKQENTALSVPFGFFDPHAFNNSERYVACTRRMHGGSSDITNVVFNVRRVGSPVGVDDDTDPPDTSKNTTFQIVHTAMEWDTNVIATGIMKYDAVGTSFSRVSFTVESSPVACSDYAGKNLYVIVNQSVDSSNYYEFGLTGSIFGQNASEGTDGSTWSSEWYSITWIGYSIFKFPFVTYGIMEASIYGIIDLEYFSSYLDANSQYKYGLKLRNLVSKYCRSQAAIDLLAQNVVERYKDGIWTGTITIPFSKLNKRNRIIIQDIFNNIEYENILITSINYTPYFVQIQLTESTELPDDLSKTSKLSENMEKELYT